MADISRRIENLRMQPERAVPVANWNIHSCSVHQQEVREARKRDGGEKSIDVPCSSLLQYIHDRAGRTGQKISKFYRVKYALAGFWFLPITSLWILLC